MVNLEHYNSYNMEQISFVKILIFDINVTEQ